MSGHDIDRFWSGYHELRQALEIAETLDGPEGPATRRAALRILEGGPPIASGQGDLTARIGLALAKAGGAFTPDALRCEVLGSPTDADTDRRYLAELILEWIERLSARA